MSEPCSMYTLCGRKKDLPTCITLVSNRIDQLVTASISQQQVAACIHADRFKDQPTCTCIRKALLWYIGRASFCRLGNSSASRSRGSCIALCLMPYALCLMPYALCLMPSGRTCCRLGSSSDPCSWRVHFADEYGNKGLVQQGASSP